MRVRREVQYVNMSGCIAETGVAAYASPRSIRGPDPGCQQKSFQHSVIFETSNIVASRTSEAAQTHCGLESRKMAGLLLLLP
jgi:hypothetical protein